MSEKELNMDAFDEPEIVILSDDEGNELQFIWEMSIEHEGNTYAVLSPAEEMEEFEADTVVIFRLTDDDERPQLMWVDDDEICQAVYEEYLEILDEQDLEPEEE